MEKSCKQALLGTPVCSVSDLSRLYITESFEVKLKLTSVVIDNLLTCGYRLNQVLFTKVLMIADHLSK